MKKTIGFLNILFALCVPFYSSYGELGPSYEDGQPRKNFNFDFIREYPVLNAGRVKPLESFSREAVLYITESRSLRGWDPVDLVFSWISFPDFWTKKAIIKVGHKDVKKQLLLPSDRERFSPFELKRNPALIQYATMSQRAGSTTPGNITKGKPRESNIKKIVNRLQFYSAFVNGMAWSVIPQAEDRPWGTLTIEDQSKDPKGIKVAFGSLIKAYYEGNAEFFLKISKELIEKRNGFISKDHRSKLAYEVWYQRFRPFKWAWIFYLLAALAFTLATLHSFWKKPAWILTGVGFLVHVYGFLLRILLTGRPPVSNMYETVIWVGLGILFFAFILFYLHRQIVIMATACALGAFSLIAADAAPAILDPNLHPLVPVLRSNLWLTVHVLTITISYAAFALSLGIANVSLFQYFKKSTGYLANVHSLNHLMYRSMQFGVVLLAAGTILGGVWADYSWGRFWGWDPKEVWALISLLCYLAILHGRFAGWVSQFGFAALSVISFLSVIMAWYGVNFVLGAGLHSYGFASGGQWVVALFCLIQLVYVGLAYASHRCR